MYSIYILRDPRTDEIKYVGQTENPKMRLRSHIQAGNLSDYDRWIIDLIESGHRPEMEVLKKTDNPIEAAEAEQRYIDDLSEKCELVNTDKAICNHAQDLSPLYDLIEKKGRLVLNDIIYYFGVARIIALNYMRKMSKKDSLTLSGGGAPGRGNRYILHKNDWQGLDKPKGISENSWETMLKNGLLEKLASGTSLGYIDLAELAEASLNYARHGKWIDKIADYLENVTVTKEITDNRGPRPRKLTQKGAQ